MTFFSCLDTWFSDLMIFFSCLDARKEAKENQGVRDASQVWLGTCLWVCNPGYLWLSAILDAPGKTSPPSVEGLSFFCFFSFLKERKEGPIRKPSKASWSSFRVLTHEFLTSWPSFLALMQEKKAKEDQGVRDASQVWLGTCLWVCNPGYLWLSAILDVPGQTSPPSVEGLSFFCFFSFLKERKEGPIRKSSKTS